MTSAAPPTEFFPGINFNPSFYNLGQSAVTLDYLNSNFLRSTGYAISRAQYTLFNGAVDIKQNLDVSGNVNAKAYFLNSVPVSFSQWTTSVNDIYYNTGNVGIGKTNPNSIYKLDVSGNINADKIFRAGTELTQYTDTNVRTVLSTSAGTNMTWNTGTNKFDVAAPYTDANTRTVLSTSAGTNMTWNTGTNKFDVAAPYTLPTASAATLGGVKVGNNLFIDGNGILSATSSGLTGADIFLDGGVNNRAYGWTGATSLLARVGTAGAYSLNSLAEDVILRSQGRILLQSGTNVPGLTIETTTNNIIIRNSLGIGITTFGAGDILDVGGVFKVAYNGVAESLTIRSTGINVNNTLNVSSGTNNGGIIRFGGFSDDSSLDLATIQNRQYATNKSELLLFKGDNIEGLTGADRIRLRAAAIAFDTFSTDVTTSATTENIRMYIDNTGNVGIGTTTPLSNYLLDVRGNIISTGNIALVNASTSIFWTGTSSNLARAGVAGEYSTSAAINDIVLRSGNNLILQSGTGASCVFINTLNNVGIGTTSITTGVKLDVNGLIESRTGIGANSSFYFRNAFNSDINRVISAGQFSTGSAVDDIVIRSSNKLVLQSGVTAPAIVINTSNNVGISTTAPIAPLTIGNASLANNDGFIVLEKCTTVGTTRQFRIGLNANFDLALGDYGGGNVAGTWLQALRITYSATSDRLIIDNSVTSINNDLFITSSRLVLRGNNPTLYLRDTDHRSGMIHMNSNIMYFLNASGNDSETWTQQNGQNWCLQLNMNNNDATFGGAIIGGNYILSSTGQVYARSTFDTVLWADSGQMSLNMGNIGNGTNPAYLKFGAYSSATYLESSNNRAIIFNNWSGTLSGTRYQWIFNTNATSYNALNSSSWNVLSDQRIKENIIKADLKTCYNNIKNINLYRYNYINEFDSSSKDINKLGYIAQEVKKHFPKGVIKKKHRLIDNREIPDLLTIDVDQINLTLYGAVKQLIKVVEKQNKRIKTLETLLNIEDNDDVENDAGQPYERIYDENEINIDDIEPSEPSNEV
jgi:hypothetical protein